MRIVADTDDAPEFVGLIERICLGILDRYSPKEFVLVKIDNWFGSKWLGFSGKALGALGIWHKGEIRIPPFIPNRVLSQRRFSGTTYKEVDVGEPVHKFIRSMHALRRKASLCAPETCLAWYSGNSAISDRASLMVYVPSSEGDWAWYAGWQKSGSWVIRESWDIKPEQITQLLGERASEVS